MRDGRPQIRLANSSQSQVIESGETDARKSRQLAIHTAVAIHGHRGGVLFIEQFLEGQCQLERFENLILGRLDNFGSSFYPLIRFSLRLSIIDGFVRIEHALEIHLLDLGAELFFDLTDILSIHVAGKVQNFGLFEMMNSAERPNGDC